MGARAHSDGGDPPSGPAELLERAWMLRDDDPMRSASLVGAARRGGLDRSLVPATMTVASYLDACAGALSGPLDQAVEADATIAIATDGPWRHRLSCLLADLHAEAGLIGAAFDDLFRAIAHAEQIGDPSGAAGGHRRLGRLLTRLGDLQGAVSSFDQAGQLLDRTSADEAAWLTVGRAELSAGAGDPASALDQLGIIEGDVSLAAKQAAASMSALLAAELGDVGQARRFSVTAEALRAALGRPDRRLLVVDAKLALLEGDPAAARRSAEDAVDAYRLAERAIPEALDQLRADLATARGDHHSAYELLRDAAEEEAARRRRFRDRRPGSRRLVHTTELRRQLDGLRRSNERLASANEHLRHLNDRAVELSARDPLTGLANRSQLFREADVLLRLARRHRRPLAAAMVDVDRFKAVNDQHFHTVGDAVLQQVAHLLVDGVRDSDLVGRYGGDEFVVLLPEVAATGAAALCERVRHAVAAHHWEELAPGLEVTVTIGIAEAAWGESAEDLLHRADQRLYLAKSLGRNQVAVGEPG